MSDEPKEEKKIIIDEDWKSQVQAEKEQASEQEQQKQAEPQADEPWPAPSLSLLATTLATQRGIIPPTANFTVADELCDLDYVPNLARNSEINAAISNSFAFGGLNTVIAVRQYRC